MIDLLWLNIMENKIIKEILNNNVVAFPTNTVFGLVAKVEKNNIYKINLLKKRKKDQPLQILVNDFKQIKNDILLNDFTIKFFKENLNKKTSYIVRPTKEFYNKNLLPSFENSVMFRIVDGPISKLIKKTGPLFASSANIHGETILNDNNDIKNTFKIPTSKIKQKKGNPSKIISLLNDEVKIIREIK
ncbi:MAG: translation factor [Candidatus Tyloplasma litorale]|nr:MAG: translation factor [Mycoplasmatales bacterium]